MCVSSSPYSPDSCPPSVTWGQQRLSSLFSVEENDSEALSQTLIGAPLVPSWMTLTKLLDLQDQPKNTIKYILGRIYVFFPGSVCGLPHGGDTTYFPASQWELHNTTHGSSQDTPGKLSRCSLSEGTCFHTCETLTFNPMLQQKITKDTTSWNIWTAQKE